MLENFLLNYGYIILFIGTFLEGETILVIAGFLASQGELSILMVFFIAFLGAFAGDQFFFMIGRVNGRKILHKYELIHKQVKKINKLLEKYDILFIIGFRFIYGLRIASPMVIGTSEIDAKRFIILNAIGSVLWVVVIGTLGYLFGETLSIFLGRIKHLELEIVLFLIMTGVIVWTIRYYKIKYDLNKKAQIGQSGAGESVF